MTEQSVTFQDRALLLQALSAFMSPFASADASSAGGERPARHSTAADSVRPLASPSPPGTDHLDNGSAVAAPALRNIP